MPRQTAPSLGFCGTRIDALVTVDERGQLVLPAEVRKKTGIKGGDKMALVSCEMNGKVCCITLLKADELAKTLKETLGPALQQILK